MTPEERARTIAKECPWIETDKGEDILAGQIAAAIRAAVAEERKACAATVRGLKGHPLGRTLRQTETVWDAALEHAEDAIRARVNP